MKSVKLKNSIRKLHLWLGFSSGIIVFILGITGCLYVFEEELKPIVYADHYIVDSPNKNPLPLTELLKTAQDSVGKDFPIGGIIVPNYKNRSYIFRSYVSNPAEKKIWYWEGIEGRKDIFVNPYSGEIIKIKNSEFEFFRVVMWLHWSLLLNHDIGQPIVGIACIIFVVSLITGLLLWWPKNKQAAKQRFWFRWKETTKWKRKNYDIHNILGYYSMIFALIIVLTGLVWAFESFDNGVRWVFNGGKTIEDKPKIIVSDMSHFTEINATDKIHTSILQLQPNTINYFFSIPEQKDSLATIEVYTEHASRFDDVVVQYDQYTGEILHIDSWESKNNGEKINFLNYDIHIGRILGLPGKILAFIVSLVCASLPVTGFYIWWGRHNKRKKAI